MQSPFNSIVAGLTEPLDLPLDVPEDPRGHKCAVLEIHSEEHPHQVVEEEKLGLELPKVLLVREQPVLEDSKHEMGMLVSNPLTRCHHHELPKASNRLRLMSNEKVAQVD